MAKEFRWKGKTEEQIKKMDIKEFMGLASARVRRSLRRGLTPYQKALIKRLDAGESNVKTHCRGLIIMPSMIGKTLRVYNGKEFLPVSITSEMLGHYLGEFSQTRKFVAHSSAGIGATRSSKAVSAK
ncbi:MAG: 30S ribosomal protein S19 [Nanoarchaeota archaeon]